MLKNVTYQLANSFISWLGGQKFLSLQMDITNACNLNCTHCYHDDHKNSGALKLQDWIAILDQYEALLRKLYLKPSITICGGEPLISPHLFPLLKNINDRFPGVRIQILTNGTRITETFLQKIKPYNVALQVSLDGPDAKRHDLKRGSGNFAKAIEGVRLARRHKVKTWVLSVLSRETSNCLENYFKMAKEAKINAMNFTRLIPVGHGEGLVRTGNDDVLVGFELKAAMESIVELSKKYGVRSNTDQPLYHLIDEKLGAHGKFGFQGIVIDYKGNFKVSSRINHSLGSVLDKGLENIFLNHPTMKALRSGKIKGCGTCPHLKRCGGDRNMSYAVTGNFLSQDIGCWIEPKISEREGA